MFALLLPVLVYMFILLPAFASSPPPVQFVLRVFGHSFMKSQSDIRQRDAFALKKFDETVKRKCVDMFAMESVYCLAGRFLMTSGAGSSYGWYLASLLCSAYLEFFVRVNSESLEYHFRKANKLGPLTGNDLANYRIAEACSQAQDDSVEQAACMITGAVMLSMWKQRAALNLGFGASPLSVLGIFIVSGLQLLVEIPTDIFVTAIVIDHGLLVHEYYNDVEENGVVTPHTLMMKVNESCCLMLGLFAVLIFFRIAPIPGWCSSNDLCSCSFKIGDELRESCMAGGSFTG